MAKKSKKAQEKQLNTDVFSLLTFDQWRFVTAMLDDKKRTKGDAADHIEVSRDTMYKWPAYVDEAVRLALEDIHSTAKEFRKQQLLKALAVKTSGLDSLDESVRQKVATEFIEWELGRATNHNEVTGKGGEAIEVKHTLLSELNDDELDDIINS